MMPGESTSQRERSVPGGQGSTPKRLASMNEKGAMLTGTLLRIGVGVILIVHGAMKMSDPGQTAENFAGMGIPIPELVTYLAIAGELLGGIGLLLGLLTRIAALGPVFTMIGAIAFVHAGNGLLAENGGWEYPLTLLLVSAHFVFRGAGPFSVDHLIRKRSGAGNEHSSRLQQSASGWSGETAHRSL